MSTVERLKHASEGLFYVQSTHESRHTMRSEIDALSAHEAETISEHAKEIAKHFGIYKQRERNESGKKDGDFIFMVRVKIPAGGELTPAQWLALDAAADRYADGSIRLTARQGVQFHHVRGHNLHPLIRHINTSYSDNGFQLTTLGACGDVNRNTVASPIDDLDAELPLDSRELAYAVAREMTPRSSAYYQVFLADRSGQQIAPLNPEEPIYGAQYLPRKFKVGFAHPHDNSVDLLTQDVGFLPRADGRGVTGYDLYSGGGLGATHNQPDTMPLLALYLGVVQREQVLDAVRAIVTIQREHGERRNRRAARWKYTIRRIGVTQLKETLRERFGIALADAEPLPLPPVLDHLGWHREAGAGDFLYTGILIPNGRVRDEVAIRYRSAIRRIVAQLEGIGVRVTPNQHLILAHVPAARREWIERTLAEHGVPFDGEVPRIHRLAMACPAKPTCGLAMTHAERALPRYLAELEREGLGSVDVMIRMAGCPNSCSRPPTAEIGIIGYGKNDYVLMVGGARDGSRLARVLYPRLGERELIEALMNLVRAIRDRNPHRLSAGDYLDQTPDAELKTHN
ncbi:NADPH-dependent assimilatory sulfite reductase hemoprotein subunit [Candidatus Binatus sp.]|jgi:sulfite reductase (ferredoxin)|uniref:NADPH-dependent assimilatory sulfite reductase hemoprotein subunit n=1 Tax=Candidatus Binatus sp. TaxID=2811406 RepID=UPI003F9EB5CB